jgi:ISXO2-like transposase domain
MSKGELAIIRIRGSRAELGRDRCCGRSTGFTVSGGTSRQQSARSIPYTANWSTGPEPWQRRSSYPLVSQQGPGPCTKKKEERSNPRSMPFDSAVHNRSSCEINLASTYRVPIRQHQHGGLLWRRVQRKLKRPKRPKRRNAEGRSSEFQGYATLEALAKAGASFVGTFHKVSRKYMALYVAEFQFRYNNRHNANIFATAIEGC